MMKKNEPIQRRKLSHEIRDRLVQMIQTGELKEGDKMLSEHELMDRFGVGRPSVREALQALESMGLLAIQHGEKATVVRPTAKHILDQIDSPMRHLLAGSSLNVEHLKEARQVFEAGVILLAAKRSSTEDIAKLEAKLEKMKRHKNDRSRFLKADQEFHTTIAEISGNPIFVTISKVLFKWLSDYHQSLLGVPGLEDLTLQEHQEIFNYFKEKDGKGAAEKISDHILRINTLYNQ